MAHFVLRDPSAAKVNLKGIAMRGDLRSGLRFRLQPNADFAYSALAALEDYPVLIVATKVTAGSAFILTPKNDDTTRYLSSTITLPSNKTVALQYLDPAEVTKKCILMGYPLEFPITLLDRQPDIVAAKRCYYRLLKTSHSYNLRAYPF